MTDLVSIIVPYYNCDINLLERAISSAIKQTYTNIEIVICNDGSDESYRNELHKLMEKCESRVVVVEHERNCGISCARNTAVKHSKGKWLVWLDADDEISSTCVYELIKEAKNNSKHFVVGECIVIEGEKSQRRKPAQYFEIAKHELNTPNDPFMLNVISLQPQIIEKFKFDGINGFNEKYEMAEITELFLRFISVYGIDDINFIDSAEYLYYRNRKNSHSANRKKLFEYRKRALTWYRDINGIEVGDIKYVSRNENTGMQTYSVTRRKVECKNVYNLIYDNVKFGSNPVIGSFAIVGGDNAGLSRIGKNAHIGDYCKIGNGVNIGEGLRMEDYSAIYNNIIIGDNLKLLNGSKVFDNVKIGNDCIVGGDLAERCILGNRVTFMGEIAHSYYNPKLDWDTTDEPSPIIGDGTVIGCEAILFGGIKIGSNCYVSAGELLRHDLPDNTVYYKSKIFNIEFFKGLFQTRY